MMRQAAIACLVAALGGCGFNPKEINREPALSPVGAGLRTERIPISSEPALVPHYRPGNSFWQDSGADLFRDTRAMKTGDVVTVKISIKDKASLDNTSERKRDSTRDLNFNLNYKMNTPITKGGGDGTIASGVDSKTESKGQGTISRSESIDLLVAAVVTGILPNGNLVISGSQEVRVNFEMRILSVAGVVRPRDISTENIVSYDKIAEARISYGGRGRMTEVQQPGWGHQVLDWLLPF
ncbi:MAG: flagellar basal body L-ring protein FlgH [bacterium]